MVAASYDLPYIQAQVGHLDPSTTLAVYAQIIRRADRDQLRAEIRQLLGVDQEAAKPAVGRAPAVAPPELSAAGLRAARRAPKGPTPRF
jgi:hypothetical protein